MDSPQGGSSLDQENDQNVDEFDEIDDADDDTDEDTEEASEGEIHKSEEYTELREMMYQDNLQKYRKELQQLKEGTHPEYNRANSRLIQEYNDKMDLINIAKQILVERVEKDYVNEMKAAAKECEEKKIDLRESLIIEYEEKRKVIEGERHSLELSGDGNEVRPVMTRKLRRRPNDPLPIPEKRRKPPPAQIIFALDDKDIESDLKTILKPIHLPKQPLSAAKRALPSCGSSDYSPEPKIEDGKLRYEKRFFHRGQPIYVEGKDIGRFAANIHNIGTDLIWVKKVSDCSKFKIFLSQLAKRKIHIERRVP